MLNFSAVMTMKGIELARGFYEEYGKPVLENNFSDILPYIAVGFVGSGSEHYGFDDELSRDHDFEPGFNIFIPGEDIVDERREFQLERAYAKLPKEYCGVKRLPMSPVGGNRHGVMRIADFYKRAVGSPDGEISVNSWLTIPDYALAQAVNGEIFYDGSGEFTRIRNKIKDMPDDVRLKRLAGNLLIMAQSGQYNYSRCLHRGEAEAAQLACGEFVKSALKVHFLLCGEYMPYYKWSFRALRQNGQKDTAERLSSVLLGDIRDAKTAEDKYYIIEQEASCVISALQEKGLTDAICGDLEKHAYSVNDKIKDGNIRNMHILTAVSE